MLDRVWLTVSIRVHPKGAETGCGGGSAQSHCHVETGNGVPQTVNLNLEARYCLKYDCLL